MTDAVPADATTAGAKALRDYYGDVEVRHYERLVHAVLEAAAPHIRAAERERMHEHLAECHACQSRVRHLLAKLPCCDLHGRNCEPPSELCCENCTEADHPAHRQLGPCSNPILSPSTLAEAAKIDAATAAERHRIAAELTRRADGIGELLPGAHDHDRHDLELMATTLRNTAWAITHGDQAENLTQPQPAGADTQHGEAGA